MPIPIEEQFDWENYVNKVYRESLKHSNKPKQTAATAKQNPQPIDKKAEKKPADSEKYGLIAGIKEDICCLAPNGNTIWTNKRYSSSVWNFAMHNRVLYHVIVGDSASGLVYETLTDKVVFAAKRWLQGLAVHDGKLYTSGVEGVFEVFSGKRIYSDIIRDITSYKGRLIGVAGTSQSLVDVLNGNCIFANKTFEIDRLAVHDSQLYVNNQNRIVNTKSGKDIAFQIAQRSERGNYRIAYIWAMASHNDKLYDGCGKKVFDTFDDPTGSNPIWTFDKEVTALASVPIDIWNKLVGRS